MIAKTRKILIVICVLTAVVCFGVVAGVLLIGSGAKAKGPVERDSLPAVSHSPLFQTSLANAIDEMEGEGITPAVGTTPQGHALQSKEAKTRNQALTVDYTCGSYYTCSGDTCTATCEFATCGGHTCAVTCMGDTCQNTCANTCNSGDYTCSYTCEGLSTCGATCYGYATCSESCAATCDGHSTCAPGTTCYSTCVGSDTCGQRYTCEGTCEGATCRGLSCDQETCRGCGSVTYQGPSCEGIQCDPSTYYDTCEWPTVSSNCSNPDPQPPEPTPQQPETTSRTWGHDSIGVTEPAQDWFLAEGCTNGGFETWVLVQNPNDSPADVQLTYMTPSGPVTGPSANLPPNSRKSFNVGDTVSSQWEVSTKVSATRPVIAERAVYGPGRAWGTDSIGASETSKTWYLAEGCTNGGFESWILVQNPNDKAADVSLTYMTPEGEKPGPSVSLPANSRKTFNVGETVPGNWDVSTFVSSSESVVAERAVYWNGRKGAHDSIGVTAPDDTWYLAEGCTNGGFETWVLVQNPGDSTASVDLNYMTETGERPGPHLDLAPHSRKTINVADAVPNTWSVSTKVTSKQPVIAERAVYWNSRVEGHDSIGTTEPAKTWYLAEGCTGAGFETWVLVQNPNSSAANVSLTYMTPTGPVAGPSESIPANSRKTFNVAETVPGVYEVSTKVTSNVPVIAERAMYGDTK